MNVRLCYGRAEDSGRDVGTVELLQRSRPCLAYIYAVCFRVSKTTTRLFCLSISDSSSVCLANTCSSNPSSSPTVNGRLPRATLSVGLADLS